MFESSKFTSDFNQRNWEQILCNKENDVKFSMNKYLSKIDSLLDTQPKSHQKITYNKLSLITENPLPYQRLVWDFRKANHISIRKEIELINWKHLFSHKNVREKVFVISKTLVNTFSSYIPNRNLRFHGKDPSSMAEKMKDKTTKK